MAEVQPPLSACFLGGATFCIFPATLPTIIPTIKMNPESSASLHLLELRYLVSGIRSFGVDCTPAASEEVHLMAHWQLARPASVAVASELSRPARRRRIVVIPAIICSVCGFQSHWPLATGPGRDLSLFVL